MPGDSVACAAMRRASLVTLSPVRSQRHRSPGRWRCRTPRRQAGFGQSTNCVQRKSAIGLPSPCRVTLASQT
jgi:hypothetical protein